MKKIIKGLTFMLFVVAISNFALACTGTFSIGSTANIVDENRTVAGFSGVSSAGNYNVYITMGTSESLRLEGNAEVISEIETRIENGILKIGRKKTLNKRTWKSTERIDIYIEAKTLHSLTVVGSGDIQVSGLVNSTKLTNTISGSGNITLEMDAENYVALISGSGKIDAKGKSENTSITIAGSGNFMGKNLQSEIANAKISGSGDIEIHVNKNLDALISGSGNIKYAGNPSVKYTKSGSGNISKY
ncbi:head GIN domain-containing protein [Daejeonella sp.]|uniref:head GIN domain-containing protein n=1 Tax=Daejeonella sp. TaxID=2805397 RepID=UPI0025C50D8A|nr:head GIN domain-containing protein [Daejeonella sp.]